jgi:hypothetical protein
VVLVGSGASHTFIFETIAEKLNLPRSHSPSYDVSMGTGDLLKSEGVCRVIRVKLQSIEIVDEFLPLQLSNLDVILGMYWLATRGTTQANWNAQTIRFNDEKVTLKGDLSLERSKVS